MSGVSERKADMSSYFTRVVLVVCPSGDLQSNGVVDPLGADEVAMARALGKGLTTSLQWRRGECDPPPLYVRAKDAVAHSTVSHALPPGTAVSHANWLNEVRGMSADQVVRHVHAARLSLLSLVKARPHRTFVLFSHPILVMFLLESLNVAARALVSPCTLTTMEVLYKTPRQVVAVLRSVGCRLALTQGGYDVRNLPLSSAQHALTLPTWVQLAASAQPARTKSTGSAPKIHREV